VASVDRIVVAVGANRFDIAKTLTATGYPERWLVLAVPMVKEPKPRYDFALGKPVLLLRLSAGEPDKGDSAMHAHAFAQAGAAEVREYCVGWGFTDPRTRPTTEDIGRLVTLGEVVLPQPKDQDRSAQADAPAGDVMKVKVAPLSPWQDVTADAPCLFCNETFGCKLREDASWAACRNRPNGPQPHRGKDGFDYWFYHENQIREKKRERLESRLCPQPAKPSLVLEWMQLILAPGQVTELRALGVSHSGYRAPHIESGFFDSEHLSGMVKEALRLTPLSKGVYFTLNPLNPEIIHKRCNRVDVAREGDTAKDEHVLRRNWLFVDADAVRQFPDMSATDEEKAETLVVITNVRQFLRDEGWPEGILADSGNGHHLLVRLDLPRDDDGLVKRVLHALDNRFSTPAVVVDTTVFNPARICKFPGTIARKGDSTQKRPHRMARILEVPTP
jgi:hypothetical protein